MYSMDYVVSWYKIKYITNLKTRLTKIYFVFNLETIVECEDYEHPMKA